MTSSLQLKARSVRIGKAGLTMILAGAAAFACGAPDVGVAEADLSAEMLATLTEEEKAALVSVANGMTNRVTETILIPDCYSQQEIGQGTATLPYSTSGSTTTSSSTSSESTLSGVYSANGWITDTTAAASGSQQGSTNQSTQSSFSQSGYRPVHFRDETTSSYCNGYIGSDKKFIAAVNEAKNTTRIPMTYLPKPRSEESALLVEKQKEFEVSIKWAECPKGEYAGDELLLTMCLEPKENTKKRYFGCCFRPLTLNPLRTSLLRRVLGLRSRIPWLASSLKSNSTQ
jgi:hypothetical protein